MNEMKQRGCQSTCHQKQENLSRHSKTASLSFSFYPSFIQRGAATIIIVIHLHQRIVEKGCRCCRDGGQSGPISRSFPKKASKPGMHQNQHGQVSEKVIFGRPWYSWSWSSIIMTAATIDLEGTKVALVWPADHSKTKKFVVYLRLARFSIVTSWQAH